MGSDAMGDEQFREVLEQRHTFPGPYLFKIMGHPEDQFLERVLATVRTELKLSDEPEYQLKHTSTGRYVSISVEPQVSTVDDVLSLYEVLGRVPGVKFLL